MSLSEDKIRIDKWLWAVRIYKSRRFSAEACDGGKVKVNGESVKASKQIAAGDKVSVNKDGISRQFEVVQILDKRIGAQKVKEYLLDLTPESVYKDQKLQTRSAFFRPRGFGRPTKKERRKLDELRDN